MPAGGHVALEAARALYTPSKDYKFFPVAYSISALASCFNHLWANALVAYGSGRCTHFAMLHSDIAPESGWLDILMRELEKHQLDMVSTVIPIKSTDGLTSTAVGSVDDIWSQKRLTMKEVKNLPVTFTDYDLAQWKVKHKRVGHKLLLNTGCWVADLRNPIWHHVDENNEARFFFTQKDRITVDEQGVTHVGFASEDWIWSRECQKAGLKIGATRAVKAWHYGPFGYYNQGVWGDLSEDRFP
jgi:hypothetical protein